MSNLAPSPPPPPPLLLTKRVTSFLSANLSPHILHTTALATLSGKLLAHASLALPARVLRRQCAVAGSIWAIHGAGLALAAEQALPKTCSSTPNDASGTRAITLQLENGVVFVIRALTCGVLFIAIGGPAEELGNAAMSARGIRRGGSAVASYGNTSHRIEHGNKSGPVTPPIGSPIAPESVLSTGRTAGSTSSASLTTNGTHAATPDEPGYSSSNTVAAVLTTRRFAEELGKRLDEKLGSLFVPDEAAAYEFNPR